MLAQRSLSTARPRTPTEAMRYLAIDFGERRIGVAISDEEERLAVPVAVVQRNDDHSAIGQLLELIRDREAGGLVFGRPTTPDGEIGDSEPRIRRFAERLARAAGLPLAWTDETLTTVEAQQVAGKRGRRKDEVDDLAAMLLLQDWLDERRRR